MKRRFHKKNLIGKKNVVLVAVSLVLVILTAVGVTTSWIEEVSQVEFSTNDDSQQTPVKVGSKVLKSDANMDGDQHTDPINLNDYFYKAGDMHLSPCYSDGEKFYFPIAGGTSGYREGTKDDANVNYMSATFRINSIDANTAYWFEKTSNLAYVTFKKGENASTDTALQQYLRCSVTIDGVTNVYALNSNGQFKKVTVSNNTYTVNTVTGRRMDQYTYYTESFNNSSPEGYYKNTANITNKPNQGEGIATNGTVDASKYNLNGNTLYTVNKYNNDTNAGTKIVTVKIWLEYNNYNNSAVNVASVNMNFVSSWAKTRRVYVKDATVHQKNYAQAKWLSHNGTSDNTAGLFWAVKGQESTLNWKLTRVSTTSEYYYVDIPAVYNNVPAVLSRRSGKTTWAATTEWDKWETVFPDTFHSETFTVYTTDFGTWDDAASTHHIYFVNSVFSFNDDYQVPYDYMWDHNSEHGTGINDKVVKNADWPGKLMTTEMQATANQSIPVYAFFFNSDYDRIIFNDGHLQTNKNNEYQTQDLYLTNSEMNYTFDMTTLSWFHTYPGDTYWSSKMPTYSASNTYVYSNIATDNRWRKTRFAYGGEYVNTSGDAFKDTSANNLLAKLYCKNSGDDYELKIRYNGTWYGAYKDGDQRVSIDGHDGYPKNYVLGSDDDHQKNLILKDVPKGVFRIYFNPNTKEVSFAAGEANVGH